MKKKLLGIFVVMLLLTGCSKNDVSGLIDWNNSLVDSQNEMSSLIKNNGTKEQFDKENENFNMLFEKGEKLELDKSTKILYEELKKEHSNISAYQEVMIKNNDDKNEKQIDKFNEASDKYNNAIKEIDKTGQKVIELQ